MTTAPHSLSKAPLPVRIARAIRHARGLRACAPLWRLLRAPYHRLLNRLSREEGLPLEVAGVGTLHVPVAFLVGEVDPLEVPMLRRMSAAVQPDSCFYDVGASIGLHSLVAGQKLQSEGAIHAFEPDLPSCAKYWEYLELVRRRVPVSLARTFVADQSTAPDPLDLFPEEIADRTSPTGQQAARHLYLFEVKQTGDTRESIPSISVDAYVAAGARPPTLVKCDIEGAELLFLRGAAETLRIHKPSLFISVHPSLVGHFGYGVQEVYDFLKSLGYTWEILNEVGECHVFATVPRQG